MVTAIQVKRQAQRATEKVQRQKPEGLHVVPLPLLKFGLKYFKHYFKSEMPEFHQELVADIEALKPGESISRIAPRGSAKSTWITLIYPIWKTVYRVKKYIVLLGDTQPNASKFLENIRREFEDNEDLQKDFPQCQPGATWRTEAIELTSGTRIEALCFGKGKIRGRKFGHYRPDLVIIDDPQNADDAYSPDQLKKDDQWLMSDACEAGEPETNYILVGTALVDGCLVLKRDARPLWGHKTYKSLISEPANMHLWDKWWDILCQHDDPNKIEKAEQWYLQHKSGEDGMDHGAKVLWPDRVPLKSLMLKKYSNPRAFASEQQGDPMPPGESYWNVSYFDWPGMWFTEWPTEVTSSGYAIDPSVGEESDKGDYVATGRAVRTRSEVIYVEAWLERIDAVEMSERLVNRYHAMPLEIVGLETNGFQKVLKIPIAQAVKAKDAQLTMPLKQIENYGIRKYQRIIRLTEYLSGKKFRFRDTPGTRLLVSQLKKFPYDEHDDGPDMLEMLVRTLMMMHNFKVGRR